MSEAPTTDPWTEDEVPAKQAETAPDAAGVEAVSTAAKETAGADAPPEGGGTAKAATKPAKKAAAPAAKTAEAKPAPKPGPRPTLGATLADQVTYVTVLVYGPEGTGKTTDALRMTQLCVDEHKDKRVLLIDAEAGAKIQALRQRGVDVSKIEVWPPPSEGGPGAITFESMYDLADELKARHEEYIGWVWDSGGEITKRLLDLVTAEAREKDERIGKARGRFQINLEDHGVASSMLRELLRKYRDLPMHGVITALERRDTDNDTGRVKYGPAMSPAMANDTAGLVDVVMYKEVEEVNGTEVRAGKTVPTRIRRAKDRFGVLPGKMPDPFFDRIVAYVNGELTPENDPVRARVKALADAAKSADNKKEN
jgi:hypothetical protein